MDRRCSLLPLFTGHVPQPIFLLLAALLVALASLEPALSGLAATIFVVAGGLTILAEIGRRFPDFRTMGMEAIAVIFVPSYLVHANWVPTGTIIQARTLLEAIDVVGLFITILIVGAIASIERHNLIAGLAKVGVPLCVGSVVGAVTATFVGAAVGLEPFDALFLIVVPLMGGGITAGALPLSIGYENSLGQPQGALLAAMLPPVILGNLVAMILAGILDFWERKPWAKRSLGMATAERLVGDENRIASDPALKGKHSVKPLGAAAVLVFVLYVAGWIGSRSLGLPAPLMALVLAAILQLTNALPPDVRAGVLAIYRFCVATLTYPVLFAVGLLLTPWEKLIEGFAPANLLTILTAVGSLAIAGFLVSRWVGLYPVDGAMVTVTRAAMGGTGDIAILTAGRRMELMPFALISTRIGGLATVAAALIAVEHLAR